MNLINKQYRPEIDGLRAVSVLVILLFHGGFTWAGGGFIGVDVFFVISGYLITRNIRHDLERGQFSFADFYVRRIRRLFPALVFTLLVVLACGFWLFSPADLERLGQSTQYAVLSLSNFFFWSEAGYFNETSGLKPLLHTWSLAVEEQFYLLWPAMLAGIALIRKRGMLSLFLLALMLISWGLNMLYVQSNPTAVFYLLPFRVFEFALGALCVSVYPVTWRPRLTAELMTLSGLGMILAAVWLLDSSTAFPGVAALLPCLGAALVIMAADSFTGKWLLSNRLMLIIGLASYSIYLIHWPLLVYYQYWKFTPVSTEEMSALLVASVLLGGVMWRWVEQPFRKPRQATTTRVFFIKFLLILAVVYLLAFVTQRNAGWPQRFPQAYFMTEEEIKQNRDRYWSYFNDETLTQTPPANSRKAVVMGNSHAVDLVYALQENDAKLDVTFFNSWHQCYHFGSAVEEQDRATCDQRLQRHLKSKAWQTADVVYLHDHWPLLDLPDLQARLAQIRELTDAPIYVFGPKMTYYKRVPDIILAHMRQSSVNEYARQFSHKPFLSNLNFRVHAMIRGIDIPNVHYVDLLEVQCGPEIDQCEVISAVDGGFLYFDYSHFTLQGAREFGAKLKQAHPELF